MPAHEQDEWMYQGWCRAPSCKEEVAKVFVEAEDSWFCPRCHPEKMDPKGKAKAVCAKKKKKNNFMN